MKIKFLKLGGFKFSFHNTREFLAIYKDIFLLQANKPKLNDRKKLILDCGSHIGISVLYFKKLFPEAKVIAFEPNPENFKLLKQNINQNKLKNVGPLNMAVSDKTGTIDFYMSKGKGPWSWGDAVVKNKWYSPEKYTTIKVKAAKLSKFIEGKVDLIKLDIEGREGAVLKQIENKLYLVDEIIVEFHGSSTNPSNKFEEVLEILRKNSFAYEIKQNGKLKEEEEVRKEDPYWVTVHAFKN